MDEPISAMRGEVCVKCGKQAACLYRDVNNPERPYCIDCIVDEVPDAHLGKVECVASDLVKAAATPLPPPKGEGDVVLPFVIATLKARAEFGYKKYGTYLRTHNGRDTLMDLYQELLDAVMYLGQLLKERADGNPKEKD